MAYQEATLKARHSNAKMESFRVAERQKVANAEERLRQDKMKLRETQLKPYKEKGAALMKGFKSLGKAIDKNKKKSGAQFVKSAKVKGKALSPGKLHDPYATKNKFEADLNNPEWLK